MLGWHIQYLNIILVVSQSYVSQNFYITKLEFIPMSANKKTTLPSYDRNQTVVFYNNNLWVIIKNIKKLSVGVYCVRSNITLYIPV